MFIHYSLLAHVGCDSVMWSDTSEENNIVFFINLLRKDYKELLNKAEKAVNNYLNRKFNSDKVCLFIDNFSSYFLQLHPFFNHKIKVTNSSITPTDALMIEQLLYYIKKRYRKYGDKDIRIEKAIRSHVIPVYGKIYDHINEKDVINEMMDYFRKYLPEDNPLKKLCNYINILKLFVTILSTERYQNMNYWSRSVITLFKCTIPQSISKTLPDLPSRQEYDYLDTIFTLRLEKKMNKDITAFINMINTKGSLFENFTPIEEYVISSFEELMYLYFKQMVEIKRPLKICEHCKNVFIPYSSNNIYCSEIYDKETGAKCIDVGAACKRKQKLNSDPIYKKYTQNRKRFDSQIRTIGKKYSIEESNALEKYIKSLRTKYEQEGKDILSRYAREEINGYIANQEMESIFAQFKKMIKSKKKNPL